MKDLEIKGLNRGIGIWTLRRAKEHLGGIASQARVGNRLGAWAWSLPDASSTAASAIAPPTTDVQVLETLMTQEPVVAPKSEITPVETLAPAPEKAMAPTSEEVAKMSETLQALQNRLDSLEKRAVSVSSVAETVTDTLEKRAADVRAIKEVEDIRGQVSELAAKIQAPDPRLGPLAEKADILVSLCEQYPELCAHLKAPAPPEPAKAPKVPASPEDAHNALLHALNEASIETLGRAANWGDLMDLCPGGDCSRGAVEAIAKRPALLKLLMAEEGVADILIEALKENGKLVVEPERPPAPTPEAVTSGAKRGWFGRIPASA